MRRVIVAAALCLSTVACAVSQQEERQIGEEYATQIAQQLPLVADAEINRYINVLGDSIARLTSRGDLDWRFYVVDAKDVNAFAVPGGFVYVNRGLIERTQTMDELAGVLGHEIGHVVRRHTVQQMQQAQKANIGVTLGCVLIPAVCNSGAGNAAINIAGGALFAKFSRTDESEADVEGFNNVVRARISPKGLVTMFERLIQERNTRPAGVEAWFATHPLEEDRIAALQARINAMPAAQLNSLNRDSPNYQTFKRRIMSLPPSPAPRRQVR
ncbi:MAG: M48 family metalloprotease [Gemmatimonadaceae bacterium]|nr:M48 family metalloprotease [Gemmatimonadaceae bacterium]